MFAYFVLEQHVGQSEGLVTIRAMIRLQALMKSHVPPQIIRLPECFVAYRTDVKLHLRLVWMSELDVFLRYATSNQINVQQALKQAVYPKSVGQNECLPALITEVWPLVAVNEHMLTQIITIHHFPACRAWTSSD